MLDNKCLHISLFTAQDAEIIRSRDPGQLAQCDVVVDVGGEFDPKRHRYDHHQRYSTDGKLDMSCNLFFIIKSYYLNLLKLRQFAF